MNLKKINKKIIEIKLIKINLTLNFIFNKNKQIKNIIIKNDEVLSPESKIITEQSKVKMINKYLKYWIYFFNYM